MNNFKNKLFLSKKSRTFVWNQTKSQIDTNKSPKDWQNEKKIRTSIEHRSNTDQ